MKSFFETVLELQEDTVNVTVEYEYIKGEPAVWTLPNGDPGHPGTGDSVDIISIMGDDLQEYLPICEESAPGAIDRIEAEIFAKHE